MKDESGMVIGCSVAAILAGILVGALVLLALTWEVPIRP